MSVRETVLVALYDTIRLALQSAPAVTVERGEVLPVTIPDAGLVICRDGDPGEPEQTMSPPRWHYQHRAEVEVFTQDASRHAQFDSICTRIGAALAADRTLGGTCEWVEPEAPQPSDLPVDGADIIKAAVIGVTLVYSTADPLG
jgi:hypothetical protein